MSRGSRNAPKPDAVSEVQNITPHTTITLDNERRIAPGERAIVSRALATVLHDRGWVKITARQ